MERTREYGFSYDFYQSVARQLAEAGRYYEAKEVILIMISIWPERVIARGKKISSEIPDDKLKTGPAVP